TALLYEAGRVYDPADHAERIDNPPYENRDSCLLTVSRRHYPDPWMSASASRRRSRQALQSCTCMPKPVGDVGADCRSPSMAWTALLSHCRASFAWPKW